MKQIDNYIASDKGKVLRRIADGHVYGHEIYLGYSHYIGGVLQDPPHLDVAEDFEEVDESEVYTEEEEIVDESELSAREALEIITGERYEED